MKLLREIVGAEACFFSADEAVKALYEEKLVVEALVAEFGPEVLERNGERKLNRSWLREQVLPVPALRARLEKVLHPRVFERFEEARVAAAPQSKVFVAEVPLHYECGSTVSADLVIVVAASRSVQVRRMMENRGLDEQTVQSFLNAQWSIAAKAERADIVIWNDGGMPALEAQALTLVRSQL
ncbi:MAG: dephospho-CoA kinase [Verrucomicrobiaceae bacterium]|nr:dephospho-CoA kinase [Verrucomicrobiaceae bacterium]